jgi:polyisoprenyl-phosphate glycosyltransferase
MNTAFAEMTTVEQRALSLAHVSVVVPAFNEAANIYDFIVALESFFKPLVHQLDIIVVNDGSVDSTQAEIIRASTVVGMRSLGLSRNFGKELALSAGIDMAEGDCVLLMDADHQHPLSTALEMLKHWANGIDMVYAVRRNRSDESALKRLGTGLFYKIMQSGSEVAIQKDAGDFRVMDRRVVDALKALPERNRFMKGLYAWVGYSQLAVRFDVQDRASGRSTFSLSKLVGLALTGLTAFSVRPLRWIAALGAIVAFFAMLFAGYIVFEYVMIGQVIEGFSTLVVSITFFSGVQLFCIGVLGEYLGRVYTEVKARPLYLIDKIIDTRTTKKQLC